MTSRGIFGKVFDRIRDRFDGDDERPTTSRDEHTVGAHVPGVGEVEARAPTVPGVGTVASADSAAIDAIDVAADNSGHGKVVGGGLGREYVTRAGDTLEAIGAYFYGDAKHAQRLRDDNPELAAHRGPLPGGMRIKVSEDPNRGDTPQHTGY